MIGWSRTIILITSVCFLFLAITFYDKFSLYKGERSKKEYENKKLNEKIRAKRELASKKNIYSHRFFNKEENLNFSSNDKLKKLLDLEKKYKLRLLQDSNNTETPPTKTDSGSTNTTTNTDSGGTKTSDNSITGSTGSTDGGTTTDTKTDANTNNSNDSNSNSTNTDINTNTNNNSTDSSGNNTDTNNNNDSNNNNNSTDNTGNNTESNTDNNNNPSDKGNSTDNGNSADNNNNSIDNGNSTDNDNSTNNGNNTDTGSNNDTPSFNDDSLSSEEEFPFDSNSTDKTYFLYDYMYNISSVQEKFYLNCINEDYNFPFTFLIFEKSYEQENNTAKLFERYKSFVDFNSGFNGDVKNLLNKISNLEQRLSEEEITIFKFLGSYFVLLILLIVSIIGWFTCCVCAWYDYCPIICKKSETYHYSKLTKLLPISFMVFFSLGLIIPTYFSITNYNAISESIKFTLCNNLRISYIIYNGKDLDNVDDEANFWSGFNQEFLIAKKNSSENSDPWLDNDYPFFNEIEKLQNQFNKIIKFLKDLSNEFSDSNNIYLEKNFYVIDLYSSLYDLKNQTDNLLDAKNYQLVLPKFIREYNSPTLKINTSTMDGIDVINKQRKNNKILFNKNLETSKEISHKISLNKLNITTKQKNSFRNLFKSKSFNTFNSTDELNLNLTKGKRYLQDNYQDSEQTVELEESFYKDEYFYNLMTNYLDKYILDFINILRGVEKNLYFLKKNKPLLNEYKKDVLKPIFQKNLVINKLNAFYSYFIERIATGEIQIVLTYTNFIVTGYQIFLVFLTLVIFLTNYFRIKKLTKTFFVLKIMANMLWIFSGFIVIFLIISITIFYFFFTFDYLYLNNLNKYATNGNKTEMNFSQCFYDFEDMQLDEKYEELDHHLDNLTFFMVRSYIADQNYLVNFNIFLKSIKMVVESYSDINKTFFEEPKKVQIALDIFNDMIGERTKNPFQYFFDCKEPINIEMVFIQDDCNYFFFEEYTDNLDLRDNDFCFMISRIDPTTMEKIMDKYIRDCDNTTLNLRDSIIKAHHNLYYFERSFNKYVDYTSQEVIFELVAKVADICSEIVKLEITIYNEFTRDMLELFGLNYKTFFQIYARSQEKDQKPMKEIINYNFRKTTSCSKNF